MLCLMLWHICLFSSDNPMADVYGANLYDRFLQTSRHTKAKMQVKSGVQAVDHMEKAKMTSSELGGAAGVYGSKEDLPEACSSILVCTGVYSREQQELPSDPTQTVTEQHIFHGHRDFRFDPTLMQPSFVVHDVKEAVEMVFQQEGWPLV